MTRDTHLLFMPVAISIALLVVVQCHAKTIRTDDDRLCIPREREALLSFKRDLTDPSNILSSWRVDVDVEKDPRGADCCLWHGVVCHNSTGHVLHLRLPCIPQIIDYDYGYLPGIILYYKCNEKTALGGKLNPSLLDLEYLTELDLSLNYFDGIPVPAFLGSLKNLRLLNLSRAGLRGPIPHQLGNLSRLQYLDLAYNDELKSGRHAWVSGLSSLHHLDLSWTNLSAANDWLQATNTLPSLQHLLLRGCNLNRETRSSPSLNFSSLSLLDLSDNSFPSIPEWIFRLPGLTSLSLSACRLKGSIPVGLRNLTRLTSLDLSNNDFNFSITPILDSIRNLASLKLLDLSYNELHGPIPDSIGNLSSLNHLYLSYNELHGPIPDSIGNLSLLEEFRVRSNQLNGRIPESIGRLSSLKFFDVRYNQLNGTLPASFGKLVNLVRLSINGNLMKGVVIELHFAKLTKLTFLDASGNQLSFNVSQNWIPPFQLRYLNLDFCHIGPLFPSWLQSQNSLTTLQMSNAGISNSIPGWFWDSFPQCYYYNLSHNQIHGHLKNLPSVMPSNQPSAIDLSSNQLGGILPPFPSNLAGLDVSNNSFSGSISNFLCDEPLMFKPLQYLNLRGNHLSGQIPDCWMSYTSLWILNLESNEFVGNIPTSIGRIEQLRSLHLRNNHLHGGLPASLRNCKNLRTLNLGQNNLVGTVSSWIGQSLTLLNILILRSNKFFGHIPKELCALPALQLLDLAHNNLSGTIPRCFNNLSAMSIAPIFSSWSQIYIRGTIDPATDAFVVTEDAFVVVKGNILEYTNNLWLMTAMDLSNNHLTGSFPIELTSLVGLRSLNLSNNFLIGQIPYNIGAMSSMESFDISGNEISGEIPLSFSHLTGLSLLNLSNNHLVGKIPMGPQLQTFDASCFKGNKLCGPPLPNDCSNSSSLIEFSSTQGKVNGVAIDGVYVSMVIGFIVGFWIVWFPLILNKSWRLVYFKSIDSLWKRIASCCQINLHFF